MREIPPFTGEFGLKVRYWVPQVHTICLAEDCWVHIEYGEEALYPAAAGWQTGARPDDDTRRGRPPDLGVEETRFVPEPYIEHDISCDIVVCPRKRDYGSAKNWAAWPDLSRNMTRSGLLVFAAGAPDSSYEMTCPAAWDYERFLDASIAAIRSADLVVATDAGLAHLAVLCGADLLLVTHEGRVAPGPVVSASGRVMEDAYWPVRVDEYYHAANHQGADIELIDGWTRPEAVAERCVEEALGDV